MLGHRRQRRRSAGLDQASAGSTRSGKSASMRQVREAPRSRTVGHPSASPEPSATIGTMGDHRHRRRHRRAPAGTGGTCADVIAGAERTAHIITARPVSFTTLIVFLLSRAPYRPSGRQCPSCFVLRPRHLAAGVDRQPRDRFWFVDASPKRSRASLNSRSSVVMRDCKSVNSLDEAFGRSVSDLQQHALEILEHVERSRRRPTAPPTGESGD